MIEMVDEHVLRDDGSGGSDEEVIIRMARLAL
jgi:hypothetical protein